MTSASSLRQKKCEFKFFIDFLDFSMVTYKRKFLHKNFVLRFLIFFFAFSYQLVEKNWFFKNVPHRSAFYLIKAEKSEFKIVHEENTGLLLSGYGLRVVFIKQICSESFKKIELIKIKQKNSIKKFKISFIYLKNLS